MVMATVTATAAPFPPSPAQIHTAARHSHGYAQPMRRRASTYCCLSASSRGLRCQRVHVLQPVGVVTTHHGTMLKYDLSPFPLILGQFYHSSLPIFRLQDDCFRPNRWRCQPRLTSGDNDVYPFSFRPSDFSER